MLLLIRVPSTDHPVPKHLSTFKLEEVSSDGPRGCESGPFGAMVPAGSLLPSTSSGPGNYILSPDGALASS